MRNVVFSSYKKKMQIILKFIRLILGFEDMPESMAFRHLLYRDAHLTRIDFTCFFGLSIISPAFLVRFLGSGGVVSSKPNMSQVGYSPRSGRILI